jgi:hypothetical protein
LLARGRDGNAKLYHKAESAVAEAERALVRYERRYEFRVEGRLGQNGLVFMGLSQKMRDSLGGSENVELSFEEELDYVSITRLRQARDTLRDAPGNRGRMLMLAESGRLDL